MKKPRMTTTLHEIIPAFLAAVGVSVGVWMMRRRGTTPTPVEEPTPAPKTGTIAPPRPEAPRAPSSSGVYRTSPSDTLPPRWVTWRGREWTLEPLRDRVTGLYARLDYDGATTAALLHGGRMLDAADYDELFEHGFALEPITLVSTPADAQQMASLAFAQRHDAKLAEQLASKGWDQATPLGNAGKTWIRGAEKGRALNYGWWLRAPGASAPKLIQSRGTRHDAAHVDYSQLTMLVRGDGSTAVAA